MSLSTAQIVLTNRTLRWSVPALLNDPFDVQFDLHLNSINRERAKALALDRVWEALFGEGEYKPSNELGVLMATLRGKLKPMSREELEEVYSAAIDKSLDALFAHLPEHQSEIRRYMAKTKVICFSEVPDSILMWAYYAEQQKGVVLGFHAPEGSNSALLEARPLRYSKEVPPLLTDEFLADMSGGVERMNAKSLIESMTTTKAIEWAHEREWRITLGYGRQPDAMVEDIAFPADELESIIFGCLTPKSSIDELSAMAREKYPHVKLKRAVKADGKFQLLIEDLKEG